MKIQMNFVFAVAITSIVLVGYNNCAESLIEPVGSVQSESDQSSESSAEADGVETNQVAYKEVSEVSYIGTDLPFLIDSDSDGNLDLAVDVEELAEEMIYLAMSYDDYSPQPTDSTEAYNVIKPRIQQIDNYLEKQELIGRVGEKCSDYLLRIGIIAESVSMSTSQEGSVVSEAQGVCASLVFNNQTKEYSCSQATATYASPFSGTDKDGIERFDIFVPTCVRSNGDILRTGVGPGSQVPVL
ncbi:MAG: hypothetical protein CL677_08130 [Bdellovibrionaceae bacterium]|nr:hypothetical protein [Pseudobdellovibrionaceae bacterium]|tara:strand:- start:78542 stop:79267 length:726 start_codon:yes stop_codon:yes gene_type:complete